MAIEEGFGVGAQLRNGAAPKLTNLGFPALVEIYEGGKTSEVPSAKGCMGLNGVGEEKTLNASKEIREDW